MIEKYFKVLLKSDVVINSKLATEGNMETLDYIPGSNFLGIVAAQLYPKITPEEAYDIFHSGDVSFGDATISINNELSYSVPFDYMMVKGEEKLGENQVYLQHLLDRKSGPYPKDGNGNFEQLKQKRSGYLTTSGKAITKIEKTFALKSAQDASTRRSKDGKMFGFESLQKGQEFIFSVQFKDDKYIDSVINVLKGNRRIGKSKRAQYGLVFIEEIESPKEIDSIERDHTLIYVESNLSIIDKISGQLTFQPTAEQLGLNGEINWKKSYIRTYAYSPWNGKRNTNDALQTCIAAGSIFYIDQKNESGRDTIGAFQAEGLGRIIINPAFLEGNEKGECDFVKIKPNDDKKPENEEKIYSLIEDPNSLAEFLNNKAFYKQEDLKLSQAIQDELSKVSKNLKQISNSQWGAIRNYATKAKDWEQLKTWLFERKPDEDNPDKTIGVGYLEHGVAYDKYWIKNKKEFKEIFSKGEKFGPIYIAKFAAQMANKHIKI